MNKITEKIKSMLADMGRTYWYFVGIKYDDEMFLLELDKLDD